MIQKTAMDYNSAENHYYRPYNPQPQTQAAATYDPSHVQAYYSYDQQQQEQYQYYPSQGYAAASYPQQYQQESTSIHPPGVPITPDPTSFQDQHNAYYRHGVVESLSQQQSFPTQYAAHGSVQGRVIEISARFLCVPFI